VSVLSEAYSHDPLERRVLATRVYVHELLSAVAEHRSTILARTRSSAAPRAGANVPVRSQMTTSPFTAPILVEALIATGDSIRYEPGLRRGYRRSGVFTAVTMPVYDRFEASRTRALPVGWAVPVTATKVIERLAFHGIPLTELRGRVRVAGESFMVDSIAKAARVFQGHQEVRVEGRWTRTTLNLGAGDYYIVRADSRHALLTAILLEPESDDGLTTWNFFDEQISVGGTHPVRRILGTLPNSLR